MTEELLALPVERIAALPDEAQAELMESIAHIETRYGRVYRLSDEERAAVRRGLDDMRQGRFASDEEVAAVFNRSRV